MTIVATVTDPSGRTVVLDAEGWDHIIRPDGHPEMEPLRADILRTIEQPHAHRNGNRPGQEWFYGAGVGPSQWIRVVVDYEDGRGRIVTAFPRRSLP